MSARENTWKTFILFECSTKQESELGVALSRSEFIIFPAISNLQWPTRLLVLRLQNHLEFASLNSLLAVSLWQK